MRDRKHRHHSPTTNSLPSRERAACFAKQNKQERGVQIIVQ
jgi:hypothetical protein